jgi:hypothetical protein
MISQFETFNQKCNCNFYGSIWTFRSNFSSRESDAGCMVPNSRYKLTRPQTGWNYDMLRRWKKVKFEGFNPWQVACFNPKHVVWTIKLANQTRNSPCMIRKLRRKSSHTLVTPYPRASVTYSPFPNIVGVYCCYILPTSSHLPKMVLKNLLVIARWLMEKRLSSE